MCFANVLADLWNWWQSTAGLAVRIALAGFFFLSLAIWDLRKHGRRARRWREYLFLIACVAGAIVYGIINDQITASISWEYFYYGKDLAAKLGPTIPPDPIKLHLAAAIVGIQATWAVGLILGAVLLIANNPSSRTAALPFSQLFKSLLLIFLVTASIAAVGGVLGYVGLFASWNEDFVAMVKHNTWRPYRFMAVFGIHLGGYAGALLGTIVATIAVIRRRRKGLASLAGLTAPHVDAGA